MLKDLEVLVARAEAIAIGEKCGIRIVELVGGKDA